MNFPANPSIAHKIPKRMRVFIYFLFCVIVVGVVVSCEREPMRSQWSDEDDLTIGQFLEKNKDEYSMFYQLAIHGELLSTLSAYNPYGDGYTLFLPTDLAIEQYLNQSTTYNSFNEMLEDTSFTKAITRYHTLKRQVRTQNFPFGALTDSTLTGERLSIGVVEEDDNHFIKINNEAPILMGNMEMVNGFIHIISGMLHQAEYSGYDWLQHQEEYSILAEAMELAQIKNRLWWNKYTVFAEHDSVFNRYGIYSVEDLIDRIATPGLSYTNRSNSFYKFVGYHIVGGEYFLNELHWGSRKYTTLDSNPVTINVGLEIEINPGIEVFDYSVSEMGDTTFIDYITPVWESCNINTLSGPVHSISEIMYYESILGDEDY